MATLHALPALMAAMAIAGGAWLTFISQSNALMQFLAPDWVRARVLALFLLVTQGGLAAGSVLWGTIGSHAGIDTALLAAGIATLATTPLGLCSRCPVTWAISHPGITGGCRRLPGLSALTATMDRCS